MKKKLFTLLAALLCGTLASFAQPEAGTFSITPKVGINMMMLTGKPEVTLSFVTIPKKYNGEDNTDLHGMEDRTIGFTSKRTIHVGWRGGVEFSYQLSRRFAIAAELEYSYQSTKYMDFENTGFQEDRDPFWNDKRSETNNVLSQHHIQLPILARYYIYRGLAVEAGLQPDYCWGSKLGTKIVAENYDIIAIDNRASYFTGLNFSIPVGVSYEMKNIVLGARYNIGVTNIYKKPLSEWSDKPTSRSNVLEISLGYRFGL